MFEKELEHLNEYWVYKYDVDQYAVKEHWQIMKEPPYIGDCEDYALTLLWLISGKSMWKFWFNILTFRAQIRYVRNGGGHAVLRYENMYADNWTLKFVEWKEMEKLGHKKVLWLFSPLDVAVKLGIAKLRTILQR